MATIILRDAGSISSPGSTVKGTPLTNLEVDNNFSNINVTLGILTNLATTAQGNLVVAINEIKNGNLRQFAATTSAELAAVLSNETGTGNVVFSTSPVLTTPNLGTPSAAVLSSATGLPLTTGVTGTLPIGNGGTGTTSTTFVNAATNVTGTLPIANGGTGTTSTTFVNAATNVTGTLPIANGGTGTTSTAFASLTTNVSGTLPIANGGTGTTSTTFVNAATNVTGTLPLGNGGTGGTSAGTARTALGLVIGTDVLAPNGSAASLTSFPTFNQSTTGSAATFTSTAQNSQFNSVGVGTAASATAGEIRATNNITAYYSSDKRFKENVQDIPNALETVNHIGGKLFDWTDEYIASHGGADGYFIQKSDFGVIAQDVQKVFPIAVRTRDDGSLAVDYEKLSALAFAALVELTKRIEVLENN